MGLFVTTGATCMCSFGAAPSTLNLIPQNVYAGVPAATIMDCAPMVNILPFGMCMSPSNPTVAAATAAAFGVLTPMPCVPVTTPWVPGAPTLLVGTFPALTSDSKCMCSWGGVIQILIPGQFNAQL